MGYYTDVYIRLENEDGSDASEDKVSAFLKSLEDTTDCMFHTYDWIFMGNLFQIANEEPFKWYDRDEDFIDISKRFPNLVITVLGFGEDREDMWWQHFKNGVTEGPHTIQIAYTPYGANRP